MSQFWVPPWEALAASGALEVVIEQQDQYLQLAGEPWYLLQRRLDQDRVVACVAVWEQDPDVGHSRGVVWHEEFDAFDAFPDKKFFEAMSFGGPEGPTELTQIADKDTFITGAAEFSLDYQVRKIHPRTQEPLPNIVYLVINTPPHDGVLPVHVTYRAITPDIDFHSRQPVVDGTPGFEGSLRGHRQYLNASRTFRGAPLPHTLPISLFSEPIDLSVQPAGITRSSELDLWTTVPPFVPVVLEHDILVRAANDAHYEVTSTVFDWGLIDPADLTKPRLKSQQFHGKLLEQNDPKSKIPVRKT